MVNMSVLSFGTMFITVQQALNITDKDALCPPLTLTFLFVFFLSLMKSNDGEKQAFKGVVQQVHYHKCI